MVVTHVVGTQRNPSPAAGTELGLAVGADVAAAVRKLGLVADATGGRIVLGLARLLPCLRAHLPTHLLPIVGKLLVQTEKRTERARWKDGWTEKVECEERKWRDIGHGWKEENGK